MKIVQLLTNMRRAGAESAVALLCRGLSFRGAEVHLGIVGDVFQYEADLRGSGVKVYGLRLYSGYVRFYRLDIHRSIRKGIASFLEKIRPDILHCHLGHSLIWSAGAAASLRLKTFYTVHGMDPAMDGQGLRYRWRKRQMAEAISLSRCTMLAVSKAAAEHTEKGLGLVEGSVRVQPNPIDLDKWNAATSAGPANGPRIIMIGTLYPLKRVHIGIQALKILLPSFPEITLDIVGDGPERHHLMELVASLGLGQRVSFLGARRDVPELLSKATVMWLLSAREGMPMVMLEAMASRVPVIATDVPGTNEFIRSHENGLLVPLDSPEAIAQATAQLLRNTELRNRLKENAFACVRQYSLLNVTEQHMRSYGCSECNRASA